MKDIEVLKAKMQERDANNWRELVRARVAESLGVATSEQIATIKDLELLIECEAKCLVAGS